MHPTTSATPTTGRTHSANYERWPGTTPIAKAVPPLDAAALRELLEKLRAYEPPQHTFSPAEVRESIRLALDSSTLPDDPDEVQDLRLRLRGYLMQLIAALNEQSGDVPPADQSQLIHRARALLDAEANSDAHMVSLARAAEDLLSFFPME